MAESKMKYKLNQISIEPDQYGHHLVIKMVTKYDNNGKYVQHIPINENTIEIIKSGFIEEVNDGQEE